MKRLVRRITACFAIAALAFAQLAVSAYACPMPMTEAQTLASESSADACEMSGNSNLCERHCDYGASSVQSSPAAAIAPELVPVPWRAAPFVALSFSVPVREWLPPARIEPPPLVRFGVLRI
jgi:hypothetical protein